jgi:hypothetical protein
MSNEPESPLNERVLTDQQARKLLERAIQLDARRAGDTTLAELRKVAQELNISSTAFADALRELEGKAVAPAAPAAVPVTIPEPQPEPARRRSWWRPLAIGVASFVGAAMSGRNDEAALIVVFAASVALLLHHWRRKTPGEFQAELLALWAPFTLGWSMGQPGGEEAIYFLILAWLASSTIGGFLVRFKWPWQKSDPPTTPATIVTILLLGLAPALTAAAGPRSAIRDPRSTYDLAQLTVLPGLIDTHVHITALQRVVFVMKAGKVYKFTPTVKWP